MDNSLLCRQGPTGNAAVDGAQQTLPACSAAQLAQAPAGPVFPVMPVATATPGVASGCLGAPCLWTSDAARWTLHVLLDPGR